MQKIDLEHVPIYRNCYRNKNRKNEAKVYVPIKLCMKSNLQVFGLAITFVDVNHMAGTLVLEFNSVIKALTLLQIFIKQRFAN